MTIDQRPGRFVTFEGPDGSGKTAQLDLLVDELIRDGYPILRTREPGGTCIGDQIRATLLDLKNTAMVDRTEALLYQAARAQLVDEAIKPHLAAGGIVLCDRYADSTLAYQGYGHRNTLDSLRTIIHYATGGLQPDLTILMDLAPEVGLKRREDAGGVNRLDAYDLDFHRRVREGYLEMARSEPQRWLIVNADQDFGTVRTEIRKVILDHFQGWGF